MGRFETELTSSTVRMLFVIGIVMLTSLPLQAAQIDQAWLARFNELIESTNFIVEDKCSGTLISVKDRLILTNQHCVDDRIKSVERDELQVDGTLKKVKREVRKDVSLTQKAYKNYLQVGKSEYLAEIIAYHRKRDLALLQIKAEGIPHKLETRLLPDDGKIVRGERVYIVGNPNMMDASVVEGVVSSVNRSIEWSNDEIGLYFQFSGGVFGGNSGGAAYNSDLLFIGIPAAGNRWATFIGFAVPVDVVKAWLREECWGEIWDSLTDPREVCLAKKEAAAKDKASKQKE